MKPKPDADRSKILSPKEAVALALALSVDSVSGGLGAGLSGANILRVCLLSFIFGLMAVAAGGKLGEGLSQKRARSFLGFRCISYSVGGI